jgi:predicted alpha/beta-fold hydrolase
MTRADADDFHGPRWLLNAHVQTLGAALPLHAPLARVPHGASPERLAIPLDGAAGALIARAWWHAGDEPRKTAIVLHGVGGTSDSRYVVRAAYAMWRAGYHVLRVNLRGAGEGTPHATSMYHAGLTADPARVVAMLSADPRVARIAILGFSLGGNVSLKLAAEWGDAPPPKVRAVATVSAPLDLVAVSRVLERLRTLPYRAWVLRGLVRQALAFARLHPAHTRYTAKELSRARTVRDYDEIVVVPMFQFDSAFDYYRRSSSGPGLAQIRVPTLLVHAEDDPMVPGFTVRPWLRERPPAVEVAWSDQGGHVGWYAGFDEQRWVNTWAMRRVLAFMESH